LIVRPSSGLVQVDQALYRKTLVSPSIIQLNDTAYFNKSQPLTVTNNGDSSVTYNFGWTNAQGISTYNNVSIRP
jgi:hypothetical protein